MPEQSQKTLYEFTISKEALLKIPERERIFFLLLGFVCNEIMILQKIGLAVENTGLKAENVEARSFITQRHFIIRMLLAKLFEGWLKCFSQIFFQSEFCRDYESLLSARTLNGLAELRRFFGQNGYVARLRNNFAFHNASELLDDVIPNTPDTDDWKIYLPEPDRWKHTLLPV
jgi:hypothetical protein